MNSFKTKLSKTLLFAILFLMSQHAFAQLNQNWTGAVGIGTTTPDNSSVLDITSSSRGLLIPRLSYAQRNSIQNPATSLMVYQTDLVTGFYYFENKNWKLLQTTTNNVNSANVANAISSWGVSGNEKLSTINNFIGTTDTVSVVFKVNNFKSGLLDYRYNNTHFGFRSGGNNIGFNTVAIGAYALQGNNAGSNNIAIGAQTLSNNTKGENNIGVGSGALFYNYVGSRNTALGYYAGYKTIGSGNVFIGNMAGYNETLDNKLYIDNTNTPSPLIYGDFASDRIGINTNMPNTTLSIDSRIANDAGVEFKQLNSNSPVVRNTSMKLLSVNENGKIILVKDSVAASTTIINNTTNPTGATTGSSYWVADGANVKSTNVTGNLVTDSYFYSTKGLVAWNKLYVDSKDPNNGGYSGLQLSSLWSGAPVFKPNGKVLTVDNAGNVILTRDSVGVGNGINYWAMNSGRLETTTGGKVVIGTGITNFPDGFNLFVKGGVLAERIRVAVANSDKWADYVFKKGYYLMPLSNVEKFIQANKHLPNVPSAQEMTNKGLDVVETNAKLMEKIEELTLYLIRANKRINAMEKKINKLTCKR